LKISPFTVVEETDSADLRQGSIPESRPLDRAIVFSLCALIFFGVVAFGAVEDWSIFTLEAGSAVLFMLWAARQIASGRIQLSRNPLYLPALVFFLLVLTQIALHSSAYGYVARFEALQYVSYGIVLLIAAECVIEESSSKIFVLAVTAFGIGYAFFALAQELTANGKIFWRISPHFGGSIYGSYVNRNHYAGLMEMLFPIPLVISMGHLVRGGKRALVGCCAILLAATIFLSGSRGGMLAFILQMAVFAALTLAQKRSPRIALGLLAVCVFILALLVFVGRGRVLGRLGDLGPGIRLNITKDSLRMFAKRPIAGWGLGTFPTIYPSYRSFYTNLFVNEAHNDYAQLLVETGAIGFGLMLWFVASLYRYGLPTSRRWQFQWDAALSFAALLGCTGILFHSFVDFNLQIPANAALFYVLCGLAASRPLTELSKPKRSRAVRNERSGDRLAEVQ
jgi:O-antigen ligase